MDNLRKQAARFGAGNGRTGRLAFPRKSTSSSSGPIRPGLGAAHWLNRQGVEDVLGVDGHPVGQSWLDRWESLQLFTPRRFSALPMLPFPPGAARSPSRVEMAAFLRAYADRLPTAVQVGVHVKSLTHEASAFVAATSAGCVRARQVGPGHRAFPPTVRAGCR